LIENISVVIIAKNAEPILHKSLDSLKDFKEVILYENGSTDATIEIAKTFSNVKVIEGSFNGFGKTKNKALEYASNSWILSLDSDEVLTKEFVENLKTVKLEENKVYKIHRKNYYKQKVVKYCWSDDYIVRVFNKNITKFTDSDVHEKIVVKDLKEELLKGEVRHYPYNSLSSFIKKADSYSTLFAKNSVSKKSSSPLKAFSNASYSFFRTYILKKGFLDGYVGLVIAVSHAMTNFFKYIKLYELNLEKNIKEKR
jgi:glycosyltransferase involved in cell wall biosynthesis